MPAFPGSRSVSHGNPPAGLPLGPEVRPDDVVGGNYRVVAPLGQGGMALVFRVKHMRLGTLAAIKVPRLGLEAALIERFLNEARAHLSLVGRPHIVAPMELDTLADGRPFLVMQLVDGITLEAWLTERLKKPPEDSVKALAKVLRFAVQVALGLDAAHQQRPPIVHRDLKPANIFIDATQTVVVASKQVELLRIGDFGLAWSAGDDTTPMGTPEYVSPEQTLGLEMTPQSDLYSLGVVLFQMIEERVPFESRDTVELLTKHRTLPAPRLTNQLASKLPELAELVDQLLEKKPVDRPRNAMEVVYRLEAILARLEGRVEATKVNVDLASFNAARPTDLLPVPRPVPDQSLTTSEKLATAGASSTRLNQVVAGLAAIGVALFLWLVFREGPKPVELPPVKPPEVVMPVVVPPPVPVVAVVDAGGEPDELAPVRPSVKPVVVRQKYAACPDKRWKDMRQQDLGDIEAKANAMEPNEVKHQVEILGGAVAAATTGEDCARVTARIEALLKRAVK